MRQVFCSGRVFCSTAGGSRGVNRTRLGVICLAERGYLARQGVNSHGLTPLLRMSDVRNPPDRGISDRLEVRRRVATLAERQGGHVTRAQLIDLGLRKRAIEAWLDRGGLIRVHRGVYVVGHLATNPLDRAHGALLAAGLRSALMGRSAAACWRLYERWVYPLQLISPLRRRIPGLQIHTCATLLGRDIRVRDGLRITSPARTLLDLAPQLHAHALHRFHNELRMRRLIGNAQLLDVAGRNPRHPGASRLQELAGASNGEAKRSGWEGDWAHFAKRYKLPSYEMNVHVAGERVDVLFTPDRLVVELDGWDTHGTRLAYENDRSRDAKILAETGIPTMRITHRGFHKQAAVQVARITAILDRR